MSEPVCTRRCECPTCTIGPGDFTGAAGPTVPGFTKLVDSWALDGIGNLLGTEPGIIRFDTPHPDGDTGKQNLYVKFRYPTEAIISISVVQRGGVGGTNEYQKIYAVDVFPSGFTDPFTITFDGQTTGPLTHTSTAADVQSALEALSTIGSGNISVFRDASNPGAIEYQITFVGTLQATNVSQLTTNTGAPGNPYGTIIQGEPHDNEKQRIVLHWAAGGAFTLTFDGQTTGDIPYDADAATLMAALEALSNIGPGDVDVVLNGASDWTVEFQGAYASTDVPLLVGDAGDLDFGGLSGVVRLRGIVGLLNVDNYLAAEVYVDDAGCDYLKLFQVSGGSETELGDPQTLDGMSFDGEYELRVCWEPGVYGGYGTDGTLRTSLGGGTLVRPYGNQATATNTGGTYTGLGVPAGAGLFNTYRYKYMVDETDHIACPDCNTPCPISGDPFNDEDRTACLWDGGTVNTTDHTFATTGHTLHKTFHPQLGGNMVVTETFLGPSLTENATATIHVNDDNAGNSIYAVYTSNFTAMTEGVAIYKNGTLLDDIELTGVVFDVDRAMSSFTVCYDGHTVGAVVRGMCVLAGATPNPGGKWAALDGDTLWGPFTLSKSGTTTIPIQVCGICKCARGISPFPCDCCDPSKPPLSEYVVDLGSGGGLMGYFEEAHSSLAFPVQPPIPECFCSDCHDIQGEYLVEALDECVWRYSIQICPDNWHCCGCEHGTGSTGCVVTLAITLTLDSDEGGCYWAVGVLVLGDTELGGGNYGGLGCLEFRTLYHSDYLVDDLQCQMPAEVTLTKFSESTLTGPCTGTLPDTITVRAP